MHGWIFIDKPEGVSSFHIVSKIRKIFNTKKVGHAGTLDPLASGLLAIALGEATKTVDLVLNGTKTYEFIIRWGQETTTDDSEGDVKHTSITRPSIQQLCDALPLFTGMISQVPPIFSAIKIDGKRCYKAARAGEEVELKSRPVTINHLLHIERIDSDHDKMVVTCSKGTYVRSLARDLGQHFGCFAHAQHIRRVKCGKISIDDAISVEKLLDIRHKGCLGEFVFPIPQVLDDIPAVRIDDNEERSLRYGQTITRDQWEAQGQVLCLTHEQKPVGLCKILGNDLHPYKIFNIDL